VGEQVSCPYKITCKITVFREDMGLCLDYET
jgi:hypothetical protein